jgi:hypothetical protein
LVQKVRVEAEVEEVCGDASGGSLHAWGWSVSEVLCPSSEVVYSEIAREHLKAVVISAVVEELTFECGVDHCFCS